MTMFSYRLAQMFTKEIAADQYNALPTPYQLALSTEALSGRLTAVWTWLTYCFWKGRETLSNYLRLQIVFLVIALLLK